MIIWNAKRKLYSDPDLILRKCRKYEKDTIEGLLKNNTIPLHKKIIYFFLLRFSGLTKLLLKLSNNL